MRRRLALAVLCVAACWPLAHRGLVAAYGVNPWKLGGFAMYTTPTPPVLVVAFRRGEGGLVPVDERALPSSTRRAFGRFRRDRHALGDLLRPDEVGEAILEARPDLDVVLIAVQRMVLDPDTARMTSRRRQYRYDRD